MCLGTFSRLRRSLATSTLYAAVRILAERFLLYRKAISCKVRKAQGNECSALKLFSYVIILLWLIWILLFWLLILLLTIELL